MMTNREKWAFIFIVFAFFVSAVALGIADDFIGGFLGAVLVKIYDYTQETPPAKGGVEYEDWNKNIWN